MPASNPPDPPAAEREPTGNSRSSRAASATGASTGAALQRHLLVPGVRHRPADVEIRALDRACVCPGHVEEQLAQGTLRAQAERSSGGEQDENEGVHRARDRNPKSAAAPATGRFPRGADFGLL